MLPWVTRIWRALRPSGGRSALTALETASIPVSEEPPLANARARMKMAPKVSSPFTWCPTWHRPGLPRYMGQPAADQLAVQADDDHQADRAGEQVRRERERPAVLPHSPQVHVAHDQRGGDRDQRQRHRVAQRPAQRRERRQDRRAAGGVLHSDRDHVVDHQRHRRHLRDARAEVLPGDHVRAARPGVDRDHLAVGQHHQSDTEQDDPGHRQQQRERRQPEERQQFVQDQLRAVVRGRDPVT